MRDRIECEQRRVRVTLVELDRDLVDQIVLQPISRAARSSRAAARARGRRGSRSAALRAAAYSVSNLVATTQRIAHAAAPGRVVRARVRHLGDRDGDIAEPVEQVLDRIRGVRHARLVEPVERRGQRARIRAGREPIGGEQAQPARCGSASSSTSARRRPVPSRAVR